MKKSFIVEDVTANLDKITCLTDEIIEGINFRCLNAIGVWEADDEDDLIEEITCNAGWCIKSIDYEIQLK